jgi:hypothetical protein
VTANAKSKTYGGRQSCARCGGDGAVNGDTIAYNLATPA